MSDKAVTKAELENKLACHFSKMKKLVTDYILYLEKKYDSQDETAADVVSTTRLAFVDLPSAGWQGTGNLYSQVVNIDGVTEFSKVDINISVEQLAIFHEKDIAFVTENEDGVVTVYCIGQRPANDYTVQVSITEVIVDG